jgi:hypothetical protein
MHISLNTGRKYKKTGNVNEILGNGAGERGVVLAQKILSIS